MAIAVTPVTPADGTFSGAGSAAWAAGMTITQATAKLLGRATAAAGVTEEITLGTNLSFSGTTINAAGGSSTWDTIGAAAGSATTANGTNNIVYNTAPTADSKVAWTFGETSAATNGTSSSGVPNQVLLLAQTLASSTQSAFQVKIRGNHLMSASPTTTQLLFANGTKTAPVISCAADTTTGLYFFGSSGVTLYSAGNNETGLFQQGSLIWTTGGNASSMNGGGVINSYSSTANFEFLGTHAAASATGVQWVSQSSRGTLSSPTVITTGDALTRFSGQGYVGSGNKFIEAARIEFDSAGTITDAATGIGSVIKIMGTTQGTDTGPQTTMTITGGSTATLQLNGTGMFTANGATLWAVGNNCPAVSGAVAKWLTFKDSGGTTTYVPCFQ